MLRLQSSTVTLLLFVVFVAAGGLALAASAIVMGSLIVAASEGSSGPLAVIAAGALTGVLAAMIVHEIGLIAPRVARVLWRGRRSF